MGISNPNLLYCLMTDSQRKALDEYCKAKGISKSKVVRDSLVNAGVIPAEDGIRERAKKEAPKFCPKCGSNMEGGICTSCGSKI